MKEKKKCDNEFCIFNSINNKKYKKYESNCGIESFVSNDEDFNFDECVAYKRYKRCGW